MYTLIYSAEFLAQLKKLDRWMQERILSTLERIRIRPHLRVKKLVGSPYFRLRVGQYRVILDIRGKTLVIYVLEVGHRRNVYGKL
jgi:mRNA interferase RelE/StbE